MRINEDFIDDEIFNDQIKDQMEEISANDGDEQLPYRFVFIMKGLPENKELDYYFNSFSKFKAKFLAALDNMPFIFEHDNDVLFRAGYIQDEALGNESIRYVRNRTTILFDNTRDSYLKNIALINYLNKSAVNRNYIIIHFDMNANVDTVQCVVKLMVSLYHLTNNIVTQVFGKKTRMDSISHYSKERRQNFMAVIENRNYKQWTELGPRSERFIVDAFRSFHPEARPKDVKDEFNKLITKNTSKSIDEQKEEDKIIRFVSQLNMFSVTNKMSGRPAINGKTATVNVGGSISPYNFKTRLEKLDAFDYKIVFKNVSVINIDSKSISFKGFFYFSTFR